MFDYVEKFITCIGETGLGGFAIIEKMDITSLRIT